jgi:hypothetical protein
LLNYDEQKLREKFRDSFLSFHLVIAPFGTNESKIVGPARGRQAYVENTTVSDRNGGAVDQLSELQQ